MSLVKDIIMLPFKLLGAGAMYLIKGKVLNSTSGADFSSKSDYKDYLNSSNTGLLLDGDTLHLSESDSFQNVAVMARIGTGKTSRYIIPNVLDKARKNCSIVVNDPKGEVFQHTSGFMEKRGYKIIVIDPVNPSRSSSFNPLSEATDDIELEQIAEILVRCGTPSAGGKDDFWLQGAIRFVSLFIKCLKNAGVENPGYFNLHNLYYLFQNFGEDGNALDEFMTRYTIHPDKPDDESLWNEWKGVLTGNKEGIQSFILNAITSLKSLSNQNIAKLTAGTDIRLEEIREQKTIIYFITPAQHAEYYSFLTSLFFRSVFNACMRRMPDKKTLPVYILYDEFGHSSIPNFVSTANTIRGYKVSLSIILQSISQLDARYGKDYAQSIQGGFKTYITYSSADPQTCSFFENVIGKVRERQKKELDDPTDQYREYNLINSGEIRMIGEYEALIVSGNRQPVKLKTIPYFQNGQSKRQVKNGACQLRQNQNEQHLEYVRL
ncbi:MAG: type IV secretory system conjugative DNA transfer family protein [Gammaproteobacteria bacterium]|nr:type IV secretory system conjugative DNA transfer family protein [Gammaproteobacteria bacterium]